MNTEARHFGAAGLRDVLSALGRFNHPDRPIAEREHTASAAAGEVRHAVIRLRSLARELAGISQVIGLPIVVHSSPEPHLTLGRRATIEIEINSGFFLFIDRDGGGNHIYGTFQPENLIEHIKRYSTVGLRPNENLYHEDNLNNVFVGKKLAEIERGIIISTLVRCEGN